MISSEQQRQYLHLMGIDVWLEKKVPKVEEIIAEGPVSLSQAVTEQTQELDEWQDLKSRVANCRQCDLHQSRKQTVFGSGDADADWMIIGEAPGAEEDRRGEPFVGRAGQLLNSMLLAVGLNREKVFIANILKCRPPENRDPKAEEVLQCENYLRQQIEHVKPKIILALGRIAAQNLLKTDIAIGKMRGQQYVYPDTNIPLIVSYHPAYLLRSPAQKSKSWQDLQLAMKVYKDA